MKRTVFPVCGGEHDVEVVSNEDCGELRVAVRETGRRQGMRVLGILAGFLLMFNEIAVFNMAQAQVQSASVQQEQKLQEAIETVLKDLSVPHEQELPEAIATVLKGHGVPQAAAYNTDSAGPLRLVLVTREGEPHERTPQLPPEWIAKTVSEMALVVVVEDKEIFLDSHQYREMGAVIGNYHSIIRYRHDLRVEVRVAQTGILLDGFTMNGETPEDFPDFALESQTRIDGRRVGSADFANALRGRFKFVNPNTGGTIGGKETNPIGMTFIKLSPGSFAMGSDSGSSQEQPVHWVTISRAVCLQTTEVTQGQWRAVMGDNPAHFKNGDDYPVENVSWNDVQIFLKKLNAIDPGKNYRLPTEAEWEYACRAGATGERYGELDAIAWHEGNSGKQTHPVGKKQPNAWELYDMLGNVSELCADWYGNDYYVNSPATDPKGPTSGKYRVGRGGSWASSIVYYTRSTSRVGNAPDYRSDSYGFRCARD